MNAIFISFTKAVELVFTKRRYASAVLAVIVCLSVRHRSELYKDGET